MYRLLCGAAVLFILAGACTTVPKRAVPCSKDCFAGEITTSIDQISSDEAHRRKVQENTFEHHPEQDFVVGFVEFDDQGWFHNHEQFERIKIELEEELIKDGRNAPAIIIAFIHGWRHTADVCDRDVTCFREVLRGLAAYEAERAAQCKSRFPQETKACVQRQVAGVMIGWRGAPIAASPNPFWGVVEKGNVLSFFSRKSAAHTIGQSGYIATVLGYLNRLDQQLSAQNPRSRLILAGHSFGGAMLFSSVAGVLNEQIAEERYAPGRPDLFDCASFKPQGLGDLVVLLNPAFEALRYSSIHDRTRDLQNCPPRRTIMMTLASETDIYNGFWFSVGRTLSTAFDRFGADAQRAQTRRAVGHYPPFQTHELRPNGEAELFEDVVRTARPQCACKYEANVEAMRKLARDVYEQRLNGDRAGNVYAQMATRESPCNTPSCLRPINNSQSNNPFKVVKVHPGIIDGHSDIYNPRLLDFIVRTVAAGDAPQ